MSKWSLGKLGIGAIVLFILTAAITGIIGNRADTLFVWLWEQFTAAMTPNSWPWFIILAALAGFLAFLWRRNKVLSRGLATMDNVVKLDDSLLNLLPSLISAKEREGEMRRLLEELLKDAIWAFAGDVHRALILLPDPSREYLRVWAHYQMPEASVIRTRFYIGKEIDRKRGVAGEVFLDGQLRIEHIRQADGSWKPDSNSYIVFDAKRPYPPYRSFICVPIVAEEATNCLGVVCFDSENLAAFDSQEIKKLLLKLGKRIATVLLVYRQLPSSFRQYKQFDSLS